MSTNTTGATYSIVPLYYGRFPSYEKSVLQMMTDYGKKVDSPAMGYLIQGNGKNILVDTGPGEQEALAKLHPGLEIDFPIEANVINALAEKGVKPEDIDAVIWTHLHWDHCYNGEKFPAMTPFYVQEAELNYAINPLDMHINVYESPKGGMMPGWMPVIKQLRLVKGDMKLTDGIDLLFTPGHTPGGQSVLVNTVDGPYLVAGDTVMQYENWEGKGALRHLYSTAHVNLLDFEASLKRLDELNAFILPGHDYKVFEHKTYPACAE